ncbi:NXPE family member 1-like [Discoglossus pictus]
MTENYNFSVPSYIHKIMQEMWKIKVSFSEKYNDEILENNILSRMSCMIPMATFSHIDNTTCSKKSRATIINPKDKYCVGDHLIVQVDMFDYLGNQKTYGGDFLRARISTPKHGAGASGRIEDFKNGTYHVHFPLFWEGQVYILLLLYHPSEGVLALWNARNKGFGLIHFIGTFMNKENKKKMDCDFKLITEKETCEYRDERYNETFYWVRPQNMSCELLTYMQSFNTNHSFFSDLEKNLFKRDKIAAGIEGDFRYIEVSKCSIVSKSLQERCRFGMESPKPSGFFINNFWRPVFCNFPFLDEEKIDSCLSNKSIYLMGDSTLRQWYFYFLHYFKFLKKFKRRSNGLETYLRARDNDRNLTLQWRKHSHPYIAKRFYYVKDNAFITDEMDKLEGGPDTVISLTIGQHFRPFPMPFFIKRLIHIRRALERLFLRSPETKVIIKAENTREISSDAERFSDFHGYIQNWIVKELFYDLNVAVIDAWDMTIAANSYNVHPPENIIRNQIHMFLTYIC